MLYIFIFFLAVLSLAGFLVHYHVEVLMIIGKDYLSAMRSAAARTRWSRSERVNRRSISVAAKTYHRISGYRNDLETWNDCIVRLMDELDQYRYGRDNSGAGK